LTVVFAGLQFAWAVEFAFGSPYLLALGLPPSLVSLVWLAGPLSGLIMQPVIGALSDSCTLRLGRRRPFIIGAALCICLSLWVVAWSVEIADSIKSIAAAIVAIIGFYALDFSINAVQATARALVVDILPPDQQEAGTACASRMINIGNVAGYFVGQADLQAHFGWIAGSHVKILCVFAILAMLSTTAITCVCVKEAPLSSIGMVVGLWHSARALPSPIQQIFNVQFFAWIGWFPFLFYNTSYVAGLYLTQSKATSTSTHIKRSSGGGDGGEYPEEATRAGSFAMLVYAIVSLVLSWFLPLAPSNGFVRGMRRIRQHLTLRRLWTASHVVFAVLMFSTFFISTVRGATFMIATCGFCWAVTAWVPFSLIGEMVTADSQPTLRVNVRSDDSRSSSRNSNSSDEELTAGVVLGIHNVYVVCPQFITAFMSSLIFAM
ncbi:hypothetical protein GQ42DRAFT_113960, partial [Ramicandelaber brevisporus]